MLYSFFKKNDKYLKSSIKIKVLGNITPLYSNLVDDKNKVAKAKGVKYPSK